MTLRSIGVPATPPGDPARWVPSGLDIDHPDVDRVTSFVCDGAGNTDKVERSCQAPFTKSWSSVRRHPLLFMVLFRRFLVEP
jgi:hypothetical protein